MASSRTQRIAAVVGALTVAALATGFGAVPGTASAALPRFAQPDAGERAFDPRQGSARSTVLSIRVVDNRLVDGAGRVVRLLGVNRPGMDAITGTGQCWSIPANPSEVDAMLTWRINAVRIPLNEHCWLGINGVTRATANSYRAGLHRYVDLLHQRGLYAILDLHRSAPGKLQATSMQAMPDADHAPAFWRSLAVSFRSDRAVLFDLYNEPHLGDVMPQGSDYWACWLSGCELDVVYTVSGGRQYPAPYSWRAAGMQQLVNTVRRSGAKQPIMLSGLNYANGFTGWLSHVPVDPARQLVASAHVYDASTCATVSCWKQQYLPIARRYPLVTAELGQAGCSHTFLDRYMKFADAHGISYLGWSWSLEKDCRLQEQMSLITAWDGTPSSSGIGLRNRLRALAG